MTSSSRVTRHGFAAGASPPSWGRFAAASDPLAASARDFVGERNPRLARLGRPTLSALVAAHLALEGAAGPGALVVLVEDGSAGADRALWASARDHGGADASATLFAATLPSAVAGEIAMTFALRGPCLVLAGGGAGDWPAHAFVAANGGTSLVVRQRGWAGSVDGESAASIEPDEPARSIAPARAVDSSLPWVSMTTPVRAVSHEVLRGEIVALIAEATRREPVDAASVGDDTPCIGGSLLIDSLDVLELVVAIDRVYGVSLRDGELGRSVFANMGSLTRFVAAHRIR